MTTKTCAGCGEEKPTTDFYRLARAKDGLQYSCKVCQKGRLKATYDSDPKSRGDYMRTYRYGITPEEYDKLNEAQGGVCAICEKPCTTGNSLAVDHDHTCCPGKRSCGKCTRGLLCLNCNQALGKFNDDPDLLLKAVAYLSQSNSL